MLGTKELIGKVVARWWAVGWLLRALPWLLLGGSALWWLPRRWASWQYRRPIRVFGVSMLASVAAFALKPFVGVVLITNMPAAGGAELTIVSTGILPLRLTATGGAHIDLVDGQVGALTATGPATPGGYHLTAGLHLNLWWWISLVALWLRPLLLALLLPPAPPPLPPAAPGGPADPPHPTHGNDDRTGPAILDPAAAPAAVRPDPWPLHNGLGEGIGTQGNADSAPRADQSGSGQPAAAALTPRRCNRWYGRRWRRPSAAVTVAVLLAVACATVPPTSSALTARVSNSTDTAATAPYFT